MESIYQKIGGNIIFPEFKGGKLYMHKTRMDKIILPESHKRYAETIESALRNVKDRNNVCYITIDEKTVCDSTHRREGIHVDFNWFEKIYAHKGDGGGGSHKMDGIIMGSHNEGNDGNNNGGNGGHKGGGNGGHKGGGNNGNHSGIRPTHNSLEQFNRNGGMLLVSNYEGCKVYRGKYNGVIGEGGDCRDIDVSGLESEVMKRNEVYYLNAIGIHEPLIIREKVNRSLIRINFHPEYVWRNN